MFHRRLLICILGIYLMGPVIFSVKPMVVPKVEKRESSAMAPSNLYEISVDLPDGSYQKQTGTLKKNDNGDEVLHVVGEYSVLFKDTGGRGTVVYEANDKGSIYRFTYNSLRPQPPYKDNDKGSTYRFTYNSLRPQPPYEDQIFFSLLPPPAAVLSEQVLKTAVGG